MIDLNRKSDIKKNRINRKIGQKINKKILKTTLLWTSRSVWGTMENSYFGLPVSVPIPNSLRAPYASTCP